MEDPGVGGRIILNRSQRSRLRVCE